MPRLLFEKTGNAVYISHLDVMRLFQRAFKRGGLALKHTQGFNPRPSVSIALPLSLGMESRCELLDFDLEGEPVSNEEIMNRLNGSLVSGVKVLSVYEDAAKIKHLAYLRCNVNLEYDKGISDEKVESIRALFDRKEVIVEKKGKNGIVEHNIIPMIRSLDVVRISDGEVQLQAVICCQNPALNPAQLPAAVDRYLPDVKPDFISCSRVEIYDTDMNIFR